MNFKQLVKLVFCAMILTTIFSTVASASVASEQARYEAATEKGLQSMDNSFKCQYQQFVGKENVIVISGSANFETFNSVRHFKNLSGARIQLTDYKGRTETLSVKDLQQKYECYVMAKGMKDFKTDGSMSANYYAMRE